MGKLKLLEGIFPCVFQGMIFQQDNANEEKRRNKSKQKKILNQRKSFCLYIQENRVHSSETDKRKRVLIVNE